jgi:hypothetical protein
MPILRACLNPEIAAEYEARKGTRRYKVSFLDNPVSGSGERITEIINARDADEAWAKACDKVKQWPSPKWCDRKIEEIKDGNTT